MVVFDGCTLQRTTESGHRTGWDGAKRRKDSKAHIAVSILGQLLSVVMTPANEQERAQVGELCQQSPGAGSEGPDRDGGLREPGVHGGGSGVYGSCDSIDLQVKTASYCCPSAGLWSLLLSCSVASSG